MMKFVMVVGFILLIIPILSVMMGMAIYAYTTAKEADWDTNED